MLYIYIMIYHHISNQQYLDKYVACPENEVYTATFIGNGVTNRWIFCVSSYLDKPT